MVPLALSKTTALSTSPATPQSWAAFGKSCRASLCMSSTRSPIKTKVVKVQCLLHARHQLLDRPRSQASRLLLAPCPHSSRRGACHFSGMRFRAPSVGERYRESNEWCCKFLLKTLVSPLPDAACAHFLCRWQTASVALAPPPRTAHTGAFTLDCQTRVIPAGKTEQSLPQQRCCRSKCENFRHLRQEKMRSKTSKSTLRQAGIWAPRLISA